MKQIYFDNSATTKPFPEIINEIQEMMNLYGNPSSLHNLGLESEKIIKKSREIIADSIGVNPSEIFFTSGGTESNNLAILGFVHANRKRINTIITTKIEHPSVLNVFKYLEKQGINVIYLPVLSNGIIDIDYFHDCLRENDVSFVSIMHVNSEVGTIQPIKEIANFKKEYGYILHTDAVQSFCKVTENLKNIDMVSISGHKIHALKGIGVLYIKKGIQIEPLFLGGGQENQIRSGTENITGIWSLGKSVEIVNSGKYGLYDQIYVLKNYFLDKLSQFNVDINGSIEPQLSVPNILNISFKGIPGEVMLHALESEGIYVSTGSACSSRKKRISHVLEAMGINKMVTRSAIRFSFSLMNTKEEVDFATTALSKMISIL